MTSKWGLRNCSLKMKTTDNNREYKICQKLIGRNGKGIDCIICMGRCGYGPYRANKFKRNAGKMPKYKNRKKGIKYLNQESD